MGIPNDDIELMVAEATAEVSDRDRTRGKTMYIRKALVRIFRMTKAEFANHEPKDGFEEAAMAHRERCMQQKGTPGTHALAFVRDTLGEQSAKAKEEKPRSMYEAPIIDDLRAKAN